MAVTAPLQSRSGCKTRPTMCIAACSSGLETGSGPLDSAACRQGTRGYGAAAAWFAARARSHGKPGLRRGPEMGALSVMVEDAEDLGRAAAGTEGVRRHGGELGRLARPDEDGPLAEQ